MTTNQELTPLKPIARLAKLKGGETSIWTVSVDLSTIATYNGRWDEFAEDPFASFALRIWDARTRKERMVCDGSRDDPLDTGALSPDGRLLATGGRTKLQVWDATTGDCRMTCVHPDATRVKNVRFLAEGARVLATTWRAGAVLWDVATGEKLTTFPHEDRLNHLYVSTDERRMLTGSRASVKVWDLETGMCLSEYVHDLEKPAFWPCLSPDGSRFSVGSAPTMTFFDAESGESLHTIQEAFRKTGMSPDGKFSCLVMNKKITVFSNETGEHVEAFTSDIEPSTAQSFVTPDGRWIVFGASRVYELPVAF